MPLLKLASFYPTRHGVKRKQVQTLALTTILCAAVVHYPKYWIPKP
jgi:hypothetical protein